MHLHLILYPDSPKFEVTVNLLPNSGNWCSAQRSEGKKMQDGEKTKNVKVWSKMTGPKMTSNNNVFLKKLGFEKHAIFGGALKQGQGM